MKLRSDGLVLLLFSTLAILYFLLLTGNGTMLCGPQQYFFYYPIQHLWLTQLLNGKIPEITETIATGSPLWADPNLGMFYPGNLLYLVLPFHVAWNAFLILHLFWGSCGVYWLCRKLKMRPSAALTGALVFLFSSPLLSSLNSNELLISTSWTPWILGLTHFGIRENPRKAVLASVCLSFQLLAGFHYLQAITVTMVLTILVTACLKERRRGVVLRSLFLVTATFMTIAIQWIPTSLWLQDSWLNSFVLEAGGKTLPYLGWSALPLFLLGLRTRLVWLTFAFILAEYFLFSGWIILVFCFSIGVAFGSNIVLIRYPRVALLLPAVIGLELLTVNWHTPLLLEIGQVLKSPPIVSQIPELRNQSIYHPGTKSMISPLAGLSWGLSYGTVSETGLILWHGLPGRTAAIEHAVRRGESLLLLREARIGFIISDQRFHHPELRLIQQNATKFYVYRVLGPPLPLVQSKPDFKTIRWSESEPDLILIQYHSPDSLELTIHRNALPGWRCVLRDRTLPIRKDQNGWMKIQVPAGEHELQLVYRTPGSRTGTILTSIGTILILAFLILL
jgi:hypothetical protein